MVTTPYSLEEREGVYSSKDEPHQTALASPSPHLGMREGKEGKGGEMRAGAMLRACEGEVESTHPFPHPATWTTNQLLAIPISLLHFPTVVKGLRGEL